MKSPTEYAARALGILERRFVPWHTIWWNAFTPPIPRGDRYQDGYFDGYDLGDSDSDSDEPIARLDIRRAIRHPFFRKIYKSLPFVDVVPVQRPAYTKEREDVVIEVTRAMYDQGKALYTRENIQWIEDQLDASEAKLRGRGRPVGRLLSRCEAPQTAWVKYRDFDGVVQHQGTWMTNSFEPTNGDNGLGPVYARSQIEFRTIQELTMPDPDNANEVFANDQWEPSVAYNAMYVHYRYKTMPNMYGDPEDQMTGEELIERLYEYQERIKKSEEWKAMMKVAEMDHPENETLRSIDKIVYFYSTGLSDDCDYCQRATFLLALATCIRELVITSRQGFHKQNASPLPCRFLTSATRKSSTGHESLPTSPLKTAELSNPKTSNPQTNGAIPIYMPAHDIARSWNSEERTLLRHAGVIPISSNGRLFLEVDSRSAVISYRNWNPVKQIVADLARPAMMICKAPTPNPGDDFAWRTEDRGDGDFVSVPVIRAKGFDNSILSRDPDSPRVREMLDTGDESSGEDEEGRKWVRDRKKMRKGNYLRVGNVPALPRVIADPETLAWYVRRKGARSEVDYWS
ncbi:hypothetical protein V8F20_008775 [Naviculisporaceae sp. PSN 640]